MNIDLISIKENKDWDKFLKNLERPSIYLTSSWLNLLANCFHWENFHLTAKKNGNIEGIFPCFKINNKILGKKLISLPQCAIDGGAHSIYDDVNRSLISYAINYVKKESINYLEIRSDSKSQILKNMGFQERWNLLGSELKLSDEQTIWKKMRGTHRNAVRQSERRGLKIVEANNLGQIYEFYKILLIMHRKLGVPTYGINFFKMIWNYFGSNGRAKVLLARFKDHTVGGILLLFSSDVTVYKLGTCMDGVGYLRPYNALVWRAIQLSIKRGCRYFNFGATPPNYKGLIFFKEGWGATTKPFYSYFYPENAKIPNYMQETKARSIMKTFWAVLPLCFLHPLGHKIRGWVC